MSDTSTKTERKLQDRLNRVANVMIGNERIWVLDRLAMECAAEADVKEAGLDKVMADRQRVLLIESIRQFRADALFLRRLEYDLGELHVVVRGDTKRRGGRYDQAEWRGKRP